MTPAAPEVVIRDSDLQGLRRFFRRVGPETCLVISGEAGIGKTTLWKAGLDVAADEGYTVLSARASEAEVALSFASLADLVEGVDPAVFGTLPVPQLHALDVALRKCDPVEELDPFAVSSGYLSLLRRLAATGPVVVAIDDVQWLDPSSAAAVSFAARRLGDGAIRMLITRRADHESEVERSLPPASVAHLAVAPLSFGATRRLVADRIGPMFTHRVLRQVHSTSQGNPLFALELGRMMVAHGVPEIGAALPVPRVVDEIFGPRLRELSDPVRRVLLAVALGADLSRVELSAVADPMAIEDAIVSGLIVVDRDRIRPTHPMLAVAARQQSSARDRCDLHLELAKVVGDPTLRARHLAIGTLEPDADVAGTVEAAAELASKRGAIQDAEELGAHALRLSPAGDPDRVERLLALGRFHLRADELKRATDLLEEGLLELPSGRARGMGHLLLGDAADATENEVQANLALAEAGGDPEVRALALAKLSRLWTTVRAEQIDQAENWAVEALEAAHSVGGEVEDTARTSLAWARVLRGRPINDLVTSQSMLGRHKHLTESTIERAIGARFAFRGEVHQARSTFVELLQFADEHGDLQSGRLTGQLLCELELRAGHVTEAAVLLDQLNEGPQSLDQMRARLRALLAAVTGKPADAARWASSVLGGGADHVAGWDRVEATRAVGLAALFEGDAARAVDHLRSVWDHTCKECVDDPGASPVAADLVEALVQCGDIDAAGGVTERLRRGAEAQRHPWGLASAKRCAAVLQLVDGYRQDAAVELDQAADDYGVLGLDYDRARTLLFLGAFERRSGKRAAARRSLEQAIEEFDQCGCSGWAARARAELSRVSGRRAAADGQLTPSERRVAALAASGLSNKEIAGQLFVTVNTVEVHLSHVYAKLGFRSRTQLGRWLDDAEPEVPSL